MSQTLTLRIAGLYTNFNSFSSVPDGALQLAENIAISKDSVAESRRGLRAIFDVPGPSFASALSEFKGDLIVHFSSSLAYWDGALLHTLSGTFNDPASDVSMRFAQQNQNLYFTTSKGVFKLDALTNAPVAAGIPAGLDIQAVITGGSGFLSASNSVAYRMLWGFKDANNNLLLGAPSQRAVMANGGGTSANGSVTFTVPAGITVNNFYQVYRGDQAASSPDDNMQLVYEANPTSGEISAKSITITDLTPDTLRGAALYTNETQEGALQANDVPPYCVDIAGFKNCLFYANTTNVQSLQVTLLAVAGTNGVAVGDTVTIGANTFTGIVGTPVAGSNNFKVSTGGSPAENVNQTAINLVATINQSTTNTTIYAYYISSANGLPGQMNFVNRNFLDAAFAVTASAHGSGWSPVLPTSGTTVLSSNTTAINGLMYSKQQEPEAVPALNIFYVGSANQPIYRILALRDSLFILKADGVFRLSGSSPANFTIDTLDNTVFLTVPDSAVALNNAVYALTTQGVAQVTDSGVSVISRPIEDQLNALIGTVGSATLQSFAFGTAYESDREYLLFLPTASNSTSADIAYVYNYFTKTWVTWDREQFSGYVLSTNDKLYLGNALTNQVVEERKDYEFTDYTDESVSVSIVSTSGTTIDLVSADSVTVGDILYQSDAVNSQVISINIGLNSITVADDLTWANGAADLLKAIPCTLQWVPSTGQDPGMVKQYSEGALIFKTSPFINAEISYFSDISGSFTDIPIEGSSPQGWGLFPWGNASWGSIERPSTIRHYIPRDKQRCTLLTPQFFVQNGWSNFLLEGLSLQFRMISSRTMR